MLPPPVRSAVFLAPFQPFDENPGLAIERDFQLFELFARSVMPRFQNSNDNRIQSLAWEKTSSARFIGALMGAVGNEIQQHVAKQQSRQGSKKP